MTPKTSMLRRLAFGIAALSLVAGALVASPASAATELYAVPNEIAEIWKIDPVTGAQLSKFALSPQLLSSRPGLAFNGTELFHTDESLAVITVYSTAGAVLRTLPKPAGNQAGCGMGISKDGLFLLDLNGNVTRISPVDGAVLSSFTVTDAALGLTFAGSRGTLFALIGDSTVVREVNATTGATINTINVADIFRGLAFSSSNGVLYGTRSGTLWAVNPDTGALLPGYPVDISENGVKTLKSGALAADEIDAEVCGDNEVNGDGETCDPPGSTLNNGAICRSDCTYCGDGNVETSEQCDDGNTINTDDCRNDCTLPRCGDFVTDPGEECDDGNAVAGDGCSQCTVDPFCGDGTVDPQLGEQCDPPNVGDCDANCHLPEICLDLEDNDLDGLIDCLDPDCDCLPIGRDPGAIRFGRNGDGDQFAVHGSLDPNSSMDPTTEQITFLLTNDNGVIYTLVIPAGEVKQIGRNLYRYRNKLAQRNRDGLARFDLRFFPRRDLFTFVVKSYGDLSLATEAKMSVQLVIGDDGFLNTSTWARLPKGWLLTLPKIP